MIYQNRSILKEENIIYIPNEPMVKNIDLNNAINKLNRDIEDSEYNVRELCIPRDHARMENNKSVPLEECKNVDHYSIYITEQVGTIRNRRDCLLLCKFPTSDRLFGVYIFMQGGVNYVKDEHKYMLRVTDELDRRIVLGFCLKYQDQLKRACYDHGPREDHYLELAAADYTHKMMPLRIKHQRGDFDPEYKDLEPYEEALHFINKIAIA